MLDRKHSDPDKNRLSNEIFFDYNPMVSQQFLKKIRVIFIYAPKKLTAPNFRRVFKQTTVDRIVAP